MWHVYGFSTDGYVLSTVVSEAHVGALVGFYSASGRYPKIFRRRIA